MLICDVQEGDAARLVLNSAAGAFHGWLQGVEYEAREANDPLRLSLSPRSLVVSICFSTPRLVFGGAIPVIADSETCAR